MYLIATVFSSKHRQTFVSRLCYKDRTPVRGRGTLRKDTGLFGNIRVLFSFNCTLVPQIWKGLQQKTIEKYREISTYSVLIISCGFINTTDYPRSQRRESRFERHCPSFCIVPIFYLSRTQRT